MVSGILHLAQQGLLNCLSLKANCSVSSWRNLWRRHRTWSRENRWRCGFWSQKNAMRSLEEFTVDNHLNFLEIFLGEAEDQTFKPLEDQKFEHPFFLKGLRKGQQDGSCLGRVCVFIARTDFLELKRGRWNPDKSYIAEDNESQGTPGRPGCYEVQRLAILNGKRTNVSKTCVPSFQPLGFSGWDSWDSSWCISIEVQEVMTRLNS